MYGLVIVLAITSIATSQQCGENEEVNRLCRMGDCADCAHPNRTLCPESMTFSCVCIGGYVRDNLHNGDCIAINSDSCIEQRNYQRVQSPPVCGANEQFYYCGNCVSNCSTPQQCGKCVCAHGFRRNCLGQCVSETSQACLQEMVTQC